MERFIKYSSNPITIFDFILNQSIYFYITIISNKGIINYKQFNSPPLLTQILQHSIIHRSFVT